MVKSRIFPAAGIQQTNQVPPLIDIEARDNIPEERIDSAKNQGNTVD